MTQAPDLSKEYPRSPTEILGGYVHLARMVDKARAKEAGTLGEYIYPCPLDRMLLDFLSVDPAAFSKALAAGRSDDEIVAWLAAHGTPRSPAEIDAWNRAFLDRRPDTEEKRRSFLEQRNQVAPHRTDVTTWADLLDLDEGRSVPPR